MSVNGDAVFIQGSCQPPRGKVRVTSLSCLVVGLISCENTGKQVFAFAMCNFERRLKLELYKQAYKEGDCWYKETLLVQIGRGFTPIRVEELASPSC